MATRLAMVLCLIDTATPQLCPETRHLLHKALKSKRVLVLMCSEVIDARNVQHRLRMVTAENCSVMEGGLKF